MQPQFVPPLPQPQLRLRLLRLSLRYQRLHELRLHLFPLPL